MWAGDADGEAEDDARFDQLKLGKAKRARLRLEARREELAQKIEFETSSKLDSLAKRREELRAAVTVLQSTYNTLRAQSPRARHRMQRMRNIDDLDLQHVSVKLIEAQQFLAKFEHQWGFAHHNWCSWRRFRALSLL